MKREMTRRRSPAQLDVWSRAVFPLHRGDARRRRLHPQTRHRYLDLCPYEQRGAREAVFGFEWEV